MTDRNKHYKSLFRYCSKQILIFFLIKISDDGIYNTYILDTEYKTWALLLHCAEQNVGARYLSAFVLSRKSILPKNVMAYLRDKLPR